MRAYSTLSKALLLAVAIVVALKVWLTLNHLGYHTRISAQGVDKADWDLNLSRSVSIPSRRDFSGKLELPIKIYVYELPPVFNTDISRCVTKKFARDRCWNFGNGGMGPELYRDRPISVHDTHQFALEVILHHKFLNSPYRTYNQDEADYFFIPYYGGLACFCYQSNHNASIAMVDRFVRYLATLAPHQQGRPHVMGVAKIEREEGSKYCPVLARNLGNVTLIGIEHESQRYIQKAYGMYNYPMIVAPYPSYGHFIPGSSSKIPVAIKNVFVFLAAGTRRSNPFRTIILDQLPTTMESWETKTSHGSMNVTSIMLATPECMGNHKNLTMKWMKHSVFCLQPEGDSPTRKSFFDAVLSLCIPVLFTYKHKVRYPFDQTLDYPNFTITIPREEISKTSIVEILKRVGNREIRDKQEGLQKVAPLLQYSISDKTHPPGIQDDAFKMILKELSYMSKARKN